MMVKVDGVQIKLSLAIKQVQFYSQYIQVKLDEPVRIKAITLQGRAGGVEKVEYYWINYRNYRNSHVAKWIYDENGHVKVRSLKITNFWQLLFFLFCRC